ncbi:MAG: dual specificity protein phosphatase family protein [Nitrososphaerota archaeon]
MGNLGDISRRIRAMFTDVPFNFGWVDEGLAVSGRPVTRSQIEWLHENGISSILSLTEDRIPPIFLEGFNIIYEHLPTADHDPPPLEVILKSVKFIDEMRRQGRRVLVHCAAGQGRSGSIAAAYMMYSKGMGSEEALNWIRKIRPGSVDPVQEEALRAFETFLKAKKKGTK